MNHLFTILISLSLLIPGTSQTKDNEYYLDISKALGYSVGIELSTNIIIEKYPELSKEALNAKLKFDLTHKYAVQKIENDLAGKLNIAIAEYKEKLFTKMQTMYDINNTTFEDAKEFLYDFENKRIRGDDIRYSDFIAILLRNNPKYLANPSKEFLDNFTTRFDSKDHPKSKNLDISIYFPKSWIKQEGKRPNVLTLFESPDGTCNVSIIIRDVIKDMSKQLSESELEYFQSNHFADEMYNDFRDTSGQEYFTDMGLDNIADFNLKKIKIEGQPAIVLKASGDLQGAIIDLRVYMINYIVIFKNYIINIGAMMASDEGNLLTVRKKYEMLCGLIANSLIIQSKW